MAGRTSEPAGPDARAPCRRSLAVSSRSRPACSRQLIGMSERIGVRHFAANRPSGRPPTVRARCLTQGDGAPLSRVARWPQIRPSG